MNLIILFPEDFISENRVQITGRRFQHIQSIHRAQSGKKLKVGLINGLMGSGTIEKMNAEYLEMKVALSQKAPQPADINLVLALPRPQTLKKVLQGTLEMGVKQIHLIGCNRVEKSFWQSKTLKEEQLMHHILLGLEQAVDTQVPEIQCHKRFKPFVEETFPELIKGTSPFIAHPLGGITCPYNYGKPMTLVVGPEGGFIPYEVEQFIKAGCQPVQLGERILRVEHAVFKLISRLG